MIGDALDGGAIAQDEIGSALQEWDSAGWDDAPSAPQRPAHGDNTPGGRESAVTENAAPRLSDGPELDYETRQAQLLQTFRDLHARQKEATERERLIDRERNRQDFDAMLNRLEADPELSALGRPFIGKFLLGMAQVNPALALAWNERYDDKVAWERQLKSATRELREVLHHRPDREASDTREAVAAAVRRGSGTPPAPKPRNWAGMSNREFANTVREEFGYESKVNDW